MVLGITYLNLRKNEANGSRVKADASGDGRTGRGPGSTWAYALGVDPAGCSGCGTPESASQVVPASWLGKGQLLYLGLLWWLVTGNFERALLASSPNGS